MSVLSFEMVWPGSNKRTTDTVIFEEVKIDCGYRSDLIVEKKLIVEAKSIDAIADIHVACTLTYLRFAVCKLGLIINFNVIVLKNGIKRVALSL